MAENRMELFIETLTGTAFELSCSPLETIVSIKAKIQYSEGIPVSQQHLIWKSQELNDDMCLQDYSICDGATLKLVLGMRVGPINTRQVPDTKKLKDLADYVERSSESSGSGGRPLTVLVFYDGDKVHMYTLMEKGDCSVSPVSATISETSSIASVKNVEDLDQEVNIENEITKEKISHIQDQLRALNINKNARGIRRESYLPPISTPDTRKGDFHLPPIHQSNSFAAAPPPRNNHEKSRRSRKIGLIPSFPEDASSDEDLGRESAIPDTAGASHQSSTPPSALNCIASSISTYLLSSSSDKKASQTCSSFLPIIASSERRPQNAQLVAIDLATTNGAKRRTGANIVKRDPSRMKRTSTKLPLTGGQRVVSGRKLVDLDVWLESRPKTSPETVACQSASSGSHVGGDDRSGLTLEDLPLTFSEMMKMLNGDDDPPAGRPDEAASGKSKSGTSGTVLSGEASSTKVPRSHVVPDSVDAHTSLNIFSKPRPPEDTGPKTKKLRSKKKRCSLCSKKTGLATSFVCRCGKNFCASHRYAETHQCTFDYKGEGRRLLQLNNPVVAAPKLPKI